MYDDGAEKGGRGSCTHLYLEVEPYKFKRVQEFKCLESISTRENDELTALKVRFQSVNKCNNGLNKLLMAMNSIEGPQSAAVSHYYTFSCNVRI